MEIAPSPERAAQLIACPQCGALSVFCRSRTPLVDSCGFESYSFPCRKCGIPLAGIVDPYDEMLLLSQLEG